MIERRFGKEVAVVLTMVALAMMSGSCASRPATDVAGADPLEAWIEAAGGADALARVGNVYREADLDAAGTSGALRIWQRSDGSRRVEVDLGSFRTVEVFSPEGSWYSGAGTPPRPISGPDLEQLVSDAFLDSFSWAVAGRMAGAVERSEDELILRAEGGDAMRVALDPESRLPLRLERRDDDRMAVTTVRQWETVEGVRFPKSLVQSTGDSRYDTRIDFVETRVAAPIRQALFERPAGERRFSMRGSSESVEARRAGNHVFVRARVGESAELLWFALDTGAEYSVLNQQLLERLGIERKGKVEARGVGEQSIDAAILEATTLTMGGVEIPLDILFAIPLPEIASMGDVPLEGILGYDVLSRFVVEVDYASQVVTLHDPGSFAPPADAEAIPFTFHGNLPLIRASIGLPGGGRAEARLVVDTGSGGGLGFTGPWARRHDAIAGAERTIEGEFAHGVGGASGEQRFRIPDAVIGTFRLDDPIARVSSDEAGAGASEETDGLLGGEVLRRFTVWIDYGEGRLFLRPNAMFSDPFEHDMAGVRLRFDSPRRERVVVHAVHPGTPAEEAGIAPGDVLTAVDGTPARGLSLEAIRKLFIVPDREYRLELERDGHPIQITLRTRRLI